MNNSVFNVSSSINLLLFVFSFKLAQKELKLCLIPYSKFKLSVFKQNMYCNLAEKQKKV